MTICESLNFFLVTFILLFFYMVITKSSVCTETTAYTRTGNIAKEIFPLISLEKSSSTSFIINFCFKRRHIVDHIIQYICLVNQKYFLVFLRQYSIVTFGQPTLKTVTET